MQQSWLTGHTWLILHNPEGCHTISFWQFMTLGTQVIIHHDLAVEAGPNNRAHLTVVTCNTHVQLLTIFIFLDVGILQAPCRQKVNTKLAVLLLMS